MARKPDMGARGRILEAASGLFAVHGVHAIGLQQIIDQCGCGKNLLYREFTSKEELVVAYLERCRENWQRIEGDVAEAHPADPAAQLLGIVRAVAEQAVAEGFRGCPLRNAYSEFPDSSTAAHRVIVAYYADRHAHLRMLADRAEATDPEVLADRIALIIDGLHANGPVLGRDGAARSAVSFAEEILAAAIRPTDVVRSADPKVVR
ncbi:TetR/AcrR family transcriptional regulator [Nocardia abscessus]|uniref:TetR/AcrR family transcriptional regulator n=1 Tax=Nocardia abscessus TaxID=120957 RepID=UPI0018946F10|nr:TetR/AcrR family transcriptional regulator [Nocardia abscessus]MBF6222503.1 TetR/AcrR family transcriptional regulator [Nocardia abscessus]